MPSYALVMRTFVGQRIFSRDSSASNATTSQSELGQIYLEQPSPINSQILHQVTSMALELYMKTLVGTTFKVNIVTDNCSSSLLLRKGSWSSTSTCTDDDSTASYSSPLSSMPLERHGRSNRMCFSPDASLESHESLSPVCFLLNDGSSNDQTLEAMFQTPIESQSRNRRMKNHVMDMSPLSRFQILN